MHICTPERTSSIVLRIPPFIACLVAVSVPVTVQIDLPLLGLPLP